MPFMVKLWILPFISDMITVMIAALRRHYGTLIVSVLTIIPIVLWLWHADLAQITDTPGNLLSALGKTTALCGLVLYSLVPLLSMRHKFIVFIFGGIIKSYKLHKQSSKVAFGLILAHPLLLGSGRVMNGQDVTRVWNWAGLMVATGLIGFFGMLTIIGFSVYASVRHQKWIRVHKLLGWIIVIIYVHALLANAQVVNNRPLFIYTMTIGILGFTAFLYRSIVGDFLIKKFRYEIVEVFHVTANVTELVMKPTGIPITYISGQFAYASFISEVVDKESHPFSFTTANNGPYVRFAIKNLGDDTAKMKNLTSGTKVLLEGPFGNFSFRNTKNKQQVWIAGGVGITPFISMARSLSYDNDYKIHLFYAADKLADAVFLRELIEIRKDLAGTFEVTIVNRNLSGYVTSDMIQQEIKNLKEFDYFVSPV
jgi:predicted ferric reductase